MTVPQQRKDDDDDGDFDGSMIDDDNSDEDLDEDDVGVSKLLLRFSLVLRTKEGRRRLLDFTSCLLR